jgi:hypothetical protein
MNEEKKEKIWLEIQSVIKEYSNQQLPDEKTVLELMELWGTTENQTRTIINKLINEDVLIKRKIGSSKKYLYKPNPSIENFEQKIREIFIST